MDDTYLSCKFVLVGDSGVGKTTFYQHVTDQQFPPEYQETTGITVRSRSFEVDGKKGTLTIHLISANKQFKPINSL